MFKEGSRTEAKFKLAGDDDEGNSWVQSIYTVQLTVLSAYVDYTAYYKS